MAVRFGNVSAAVAVLDVAVAMLMVVTVVVMLTPVGTSTMTPMSETVVQRRVVLATLVPRVVGMVAQGPAAASHVTPMMVLMRVQVTTVVVVVVVARAVTMVTSVTVAPLRKTDASCMRAVIVLGVTAMALITAALGATDWAIHHSSIAIVVVAMMSLVPRVVTAALVRTIILSSMRAVIGLGVNTTAMITAARGAIA